MQGLKLGGGGTGGGLGGTGLAGGLKLGGQTSGLGQTGMGLNLGGGGLAMGLGQQRPGNLGLGLNQQQQGGGGLGLNAASGLKRGGIEQAGIGLNLGQKVGTGLSLGGSGLGTAQTTTGLSGGLGTALGQQQQQIGLGTRLGGGLGTNIVGGLGTGLGRGIVTGGGGLGTGLGGIGQTGLGGGGLGNRLVGGGGLSTGLGGGGLNTALGGGLSTGLGGGGLNTGLGLGAGSTLGGLSLAGTQKGPAQGIFSQSSLQPQNNQATQQQLISTQLLISSVTMPALFQDERDVIVKKFNQLGAYCGAGMGLASYAGQAQLVEFQPSNPLARFKTICYSRIPMVKNEDGLVGLQFSKECSVLTSQKESVTRSLQSMLSGSPVCVVVDSIRPLPNNWSEMIIYILGQSPVGSTKRLLATDTCMYLQQAARKPQLEALGVVGVAPKTGFSEEDLKAYLASPPSGISAQIWEQSQKENPDPQKYIPVVIVGSAELLDRVKHQQQESRQHELRLEVISDELTQLVQTQSTSIAKLTEYRRRLNDISHSVLRVMVMQEKLRKSGWSVQTSEEQLRAKLEGIQSELDSPTMLKGRLNELMSQLRLQVHKDGTASGPRTDTKVVLEPALYDNIREHLAQQQEALSQMVRLIKQDMKDLQVMSTGLSKDMT